MKSLDERKADRKQRAEDAAAKARDNASIMNPNASNGETDYSKLTVAELKAEADAKGLTYEANAKKADLVALLEAAE